ncbi:LOW QUALITY PROTEIN: GlcNac transferase [Phytophthora palmivora]|uniref:GlcNac transferase n=1 Tax=Phytophthora palmivora TaxID=4796 RepID=A0A2P4XGX4_9STRA|nr:LOW QUALITY PROTEIN: GlcNac transferase [Phytophthora palmivora]
MMKSGFESTMGIVETNRSSTQHIPLNPSQSHLRPPPPRVPNDPTLFVGLSVFRDGYRCAKTNFTGLKRATNPNNVVFGLIKCTHLTKNVWMHFVSWLQNSVLIRITFESMNVQRESRGPTLARHQQQKLIQDEEFCLQLDGHSIFTNGWDENLLKEWKGIGNEMAVMTTYIHHIHIFVVDNGDNVPPKKLELPHLCTTMRGVNGLVRTVGASMIGGSKMPQLEALWGAGFSYNKCQAEKRVPVDSHTLWIFDGEEFLRASRLWTHGYDMYSPSTLGTVVYHTYTSVSARFEGIPVEQKIKDKEEEMGINRFKLLVGQSFEGRVSTIELDKFGFGNVRSFKQYLEFSGVTFDEGKKDAESCEQRHWVPYSNATDVEEIVGGGWKLYDTNTPKSSRQNDLEIAGRLRQRVPDNVNTNTFTSLLSVFVVVGIAVFVVAFSNNSFSRRIRRHVRSKAQHNSSE